MGNLTRGKTDELLVLTAQPIIGTPASENYDTTLGRIAKFQDSPLRLYASATPDAILHIAANKVQAGDGTYRATPPSNSTLPTYAGSTINFDTAAITGGAVTKEGSTFALPTLTGTGKFVRMAFAYNTTANAIDTTFSAEAASQGALVDPGTLYPLIPGQKRGYIDLVSVSAANKFKTATSAGAVPLIENADIITFGSGSASDGSGGGASLLDPNYDETFIYYTRSDFAIDQKKFFGSTTGTDSILGLGKVVFTAGSQTLISSNLLGTVFLADAPVVNTAQVRLLYNVGKVDSAPVIAVALDGAAGSPTWVAATKTEVSGLFVIADFVFPAGSTSTDTRVRVTSSAGSKELAGFGVNLCQDSTGSYAGDATKEVRTITSTEASTGLITLASVRFTPGAGQLHCNYKGHDFIEPDFICLGGGAVQFPLAFFTTGDVAKFYVGYGMVNLSNAPVTVNNMLSSNSTLGSVEVLSGFTLDKPYMEIPAGATITGVGAISTDGYITGDGILANYRDRNI